MFISLEEKKKKNPTKQNPQNPLPGSTVWLGVKQREMFATSGREVGE